MLTFTATCLYILLNFGGSRDEPVKLALAETQEKKPVWKPKDKHSRSTLSSHSLWIIVYRSTARRISRMQHTRGKLRQEDLHKFEASLGCVVKHRTAAKKLHYSLQSSILAFSQFLILYPLLCNIK